jgi:hypothetical protein
MFTFELRAPRRPRLSIGRSLYPEVFQPFAGSKLRRNPVWFPATACPGLRRILWILVLGMNLGVWATPVMPLSTAINPKRTKPLLKRGLLRRYFASQFGDDFLMKTP